MIYALFFVCTLLINPLFGQILQYENQTIEKIDVVIHTASGVTADNRTVLSRIRAKQGGLFSQSDFDEDLKTLSQDFDRIVPTVESIDSKVYVTLDIWPKPQIHHIRWVGNEKVLTRRLSKELDISTHSIFERQKFNTAFHKLKAYYIRKGFFEAELDYEVLFNCETNEVDIVITIKEGRSGRIEAINFVNFSDCEEKEILAEMVTKKYNLFTSWLSQEGTYNPDAVQQDRLTIINYLQNEGYADADVTIEEIESKTKNRIILQITATRGEQYFLNQISFDGNKILDDETINSLFLVRPGFPFSPDMIRKTVDQITDAYGKIGYIDAFVDFDTELVEDQHLYNATFKIEEGQQYRVGMIRVFGNISTQTPVILHETLLVPGEVFNSLKLKKTEERLQNVGYFKNVNVYIVKSEDTILGSDYRDVYIEVEETSTGQAGAFLGYSSVDEIFGGVNLTEQNFNYKGISRVWRDGLRALRGGGEYAHFTATIGQKSTSYILSWTKPHFMDTKWSVGADLTKTSTRYISKEYDLSTAALNLRAQYDINPFVRAGFHYRLKNGNVYLHNMHHEEKDHPQTAKQLEEEARIHGLISAVGTSMTYDSTNHPIRPTKGFRSKLSLEFAGLGGDHSFFSLGYLNTYYVSVDSHTVIKYRADLRFIQPVFGTHYSTLPLDERFFLGGENTVRGYRPYRLGPQYKGSQHIPRGGLSMQVYSVEITRTLFKDFEVFAFFDAGQLSKETWEFGRLSASVGYGTRFKLFIASIPAITLGMGYPLNARDRSEVKKFFISLGENF